MNEEVTDPYADITAGLGSRLTELLAGAGTGAVSPGGGPGQVYLGE